MIPPSASALAKSGIAGLATRPIAPRTSAASRRTSLLSSFLPSLSPQHSIHCTRLGYDARIASPPHLYWNMGLRNLLICCFAHPGSHVEPRTNWPFSRSGAEGSLLVATTMHRLFVRNWSWPT